MSVPQKGSGNLHGSREIQNKYIGKERGTGLIYSLEKHLKNNYTEFILFYGSREGERERDIGSIESSINVQ